MHFDGLTFETQQIFDHNEKFGNFIHVYCENFSQLFCLIFYRAQHHEVKLPQDFTCDDCTVRLLRQASEWVNNYRFWSCADVDIIPQKKYRETCGGHGRAVAGRCVCNKGWCNCKVQNDLGRILDLVKD